MSRRTFTLALVCVLSASLVCAPATAHDRWRHRPPHYRVGGDWHAPPWGPYGAPPVHFGFRCATPTGFHPLIAPLPFGSPCSGLNPWTGYWEWGYVR